MSDIREKIVDWIVMLSSSHFKDTDAELVKNEMLNLIEIEGKKALITQVNNQVDEDNNSHKRSVYADKPDTPGVRGKNDPR